MSEELRPCPFCGDEKVGIYLDFDPKRSRYGVICYWCGANTAPNSKTEEDAAKIWNARPEERKNS